MIRLIGITVVDSEALDLRFSDGSQGRWSAATLLARETILTRALREPGYFARAFIEGGALAWPNGLELSAVALHQRLGNAGLLIDRAA